MAGAIEIKLTPGVGEELEAIVGRR